MYSKPIIRFVKKGDINQLVDLCEAHSLYEQCLYDRTSKAEKLTDDLFSKVPKVFCLVVENDNRLIGYATFMKQYATWDACEYIYMDCLFMKENARGFGIGELLIRKIQAEGIKLGCKLVQWQTPTFNIDAIRFYERIGANSKDKKRFFLE